MNQWLGVPWSVPFGKPDLSVDPGTPAIALPRSLFRKARKMARAQGRTYESPYDALTPDDAAALRKRRVGGVGERRTALILLGLKRWRGTVIAHDVQVSETSNANGDHLVIAPSGVYLIDSKMLGTIRDSADPEAWSPPGRRSRTSLTAAAGTDPDRAGDGMGNRRSRPTCGIPCIR